MFIFLFKEINNIKLIIICNFISKMKIDYLKLFNKNVYKVKNVLNILINKNMN